jgi:hypothetical protein
VSSPGEGEAVRAYGLLEEHGFVEDLAVITLNMSLIRPANEKRT